MPFLAKNDLEKKKIVAVLFKGGDAAKNPRFLGCVENALGLREWVEEKGHTLVVTDDKDGENSYFDKELIDANIVITTPFHPAYMTAERIGKATKLELILTAGIGSDHIDLHAAAKKGLTVAEVTGSNVVSVAEDEVMRILILMRNFLPAWQQIGRGEWNVGEVATRAQDLEAKTVGTLGAGRIGLEVLKRLQPWGLNLLYYARHNNEKANSFGARWEKDLDTFLGKCDVVTVNVPLSDKTRGMLTKEKLDKMKHGAYLVNNARGAIVVVDDVVEACQSGQLGGYSGDVWYPQPPGKDHPWRTMPNQAMTCHLSGATLDAQKRYSAGTKDNLSNFFEGKKLLDDNYIVREGKLAPQYE